MKIKRILKNKDLELAFRSGLITFYILSCFVVAVLLMGKIYTEVELTAFGKTAVFFKRIDTDEYVFFGKRFYFPIVSYCEKVVWFIKAYSPGIIKLLCLCLKKTEELLISLIY